MIYELKLWKSEFPKYTEKPKKIIRFTDYGSKGRAIQHGESIARKGGFGKMALSELNFGSTKDHGYGKGREPIIVGSVMNNPRRKKSKRRPYRRNSARKHIIRSLKRYSRKTRRNPNSALSQPGVEQLREKGMALTNGAGWYVTVWANKKHTKTIKVWAA